VDINEIKKKYHEIVVEEKAMEKKSMKNKKGKKAKS